MKASLFDISFAAIDSRTRNMSFSFMLTMKDEVSSEVLEQGALRAFRCYPKSDCKLRGREWTRDPSGFKIESLGITEFVNRPLLITESRGVEQTVVRQDGRMILVTKFHHATCDGISALLWLSAQLLEDEVSPKELSLRTSVATALRSRYAHTRSSDSFPADRSSPGNVRGWLSFDIPRLDGRFRGFTHNDLLIAVLFRSLDFWNEQRGFREKKLGIYVPYNIRTHATEGFGNGASRVKVYPCPQEGVGIGDYARFIREQVGWCKSNGLWGIPRFMNFYSAAPARLTSTVLTFLAKLHSSDFCSLLFSHLDLSKVGGGLFEKIDDLEIVAPLIEHYSMSLIATTFEKRTRLTVTWDTAQLKREDVESFTRAFDELYKSSLHLLSEDGSLTCT